LLSNVSQVFFGVNDLPTAEYVSNRLGEATITVTSGGTSSGSSRSASATGQSNSSSWNKNENWQLHARKLLKPEEVMALPDRTAITFTPGVPPVGTTLVRYYEEPNLGRGFGLWRRFKAAVKVLFQSAGLLALVVFLAVQIAKEGQQRLAARQQFIKRHVHTTHQ
jgi:type IV secretion system protein VirD4